MRQSSRRSFLLWTLAAGASVGGAFAQDGAAGVIANDSEIAALLAGRIDGQRRGTGAAVGIVRGGHFSFVRHGVAALDQSAPVGSRSVFQIASLTKIFTALLFADAAWRGELALDDPLDRHLPVAAPNFEGRSISLLDLATHTSGLALRPASRVGRSQDNPYAGYAEADLYADLQSVRLTRAPGAAFEYSNFDYGLLGAALSNRLGRSYWELLHERILDPLDMLETKLDPTAAMRRRMVQGYDAQFAPMRPWDFGALAPAGGLYSTIRDLKKFVGLWGDTDGALLRAAHSMLAITRPGDDANTRMAIGWRVVQRNGRRLAWSNGNGGGVRSFMAAADRSGAVIAFANMATGVGVDDIGLHVLDRSVPVDVAPIPVRTAIEVSPHILDQYAGAYVYAPGDTLTIERAADGLALVQGAGRIALFAQTPTLFFMREDNITFEFRVLSDGRAQELVLTQGGQTYLYRRAQ